MRDFFSNEKNDRVDREIDAVLEEMGKTGVRGEDYPKMMAYLERLVDVKVKDKPAPVSRNTLALIVGNIAGTILIVAYEQKHMIVTQRLNQLIRPRIE